MANQIQSCFRRYEKKYCLTAAQQRFLLEGMAPYMKKDAYGAYGIRRRAQALRRMLCGFGAKQRPVKSVCACCNVPAKKTAARRFFKSGSVNFL